MIETIAVVVSTLLVLLLAIVSNDTDKVNTRQAERRGMRDLKEAIRRKR